MRASRLKQCTQTHSTSCYNRTTSVCIVSDSNHGPLVCRANDLPLSYTGSLSNCYVINDRLCRALRVFETLSVSDYLDIRGHAVVIIRHEFCLLSTDFHSIVFPCYFYSATSCRSSVPLPASPSMLSANLKLVSCLPPMQIQMGNLLTIPSAITKSKT